MDFINNLKVRCSSIHAVLAENTENRCLTEKQTERLKELEAKESLSLNMKKELADLIVKKENGSKVILSAGCISYLMCEYAWQTEGKVSVTKELMDIPQMQKGNIVEEESLRILSWVDGIDYIPNVNRETGERERVYNDYLSGEVDAYAGESIMKAKVIPDIKSIWDYPTFLCKIHEPLTKANDLQIKGYLDISGAKEGFVANVLTDTPPHIIESYKFRLLSKLNVATEESPEFKEAWEIISRSMVFNTIPVHKRVFKKKVEPMSAVQTQLLYDRIKICREWLNQFHEKYESINIPAELIEP